MSAVAERHPCEGHPTWRRCPHQNLAREGRRWCGLCDPDERAARAADKDRRRREDAGTWRRLVELVASEHARANVEGRRGDADALFEIADLVRRLAR